MFKRYIFVSLIGVALLLSFFLCYQRWSWERTYRKVSIAVDGNSLYDLSLQQGKTFEKILDEMRSAGVTTVGIKEETLSDLKRYGRIEIIYGSSFHTLFSEAGTTYILTREKELAQRIARFLHTNVSQQEKNWLVKMPGVNPYFEENEGLGFSVEPIRLVKKARLNVVLRPLSLKGLQDWKDWSSVEALLFLGRAVPGYPDTIETLQQTLSSLPVQIGAIEFVSQQGFPQLLSADLKKRVVRVHSLSEKEIEDIEEEKRKATLDDIVERWARAVRERNVRLLYLHFFHKPLKSEFNDVSQWNVQYVREIVSRLRSLGYTFGENDKASFVQSSKPVLFILMLGVFSLALLVIKPYFPAMKSLTTLTGVGALLSGGAVIVLPTAMSAKIGALGASIIVPLAIVAWIEKKLQYGEQSASGYSRVILIFSTITGFTLGGVLLIVGFLYGQNFWLKLDAFVGIKIALVLPLIIAFFMVRRDFTWQKILRQPLTIGFFLAGLSALLVLAIFVWRSGNEGGMLAGTLERSFRGALDNLLLVRPRTKEILFGHPLLILFIYHALRGRKNVLLLLAGLVGQISILNTFVHAHTPLYISFLRTFHGWWVGILIGWCFIQVYERLLSDKKGEQLRLNLGADEVSAPGKSVLISGYYGCDNLGDELILKAIVSDLRSLDKTIDITVISSNPVRTMELHPSVKAIKRTDIKNIFTACRKCDLFISGGGGLLQDSTGQGSVIYYLGLSWLAKHLAGKKVMFYAQGIGPLRKKLSRWLLKKGLKKIDLVTLRDHSSMTFLETQEKTSLPYITVDPVLGIAIPETKKKAKQKGTRIGIVLRKDHVDKRQLETWLDIIGAIQLQGEIWLIPFQKGEDVALSEAIKEKLSDKVYLKRWEKIEDIFSLFAEVDIVISMRLHALILAALYSKPMLGVSYDQKIDYFLHLLGQKAYRTEDVVDCLKDISALGLTTEQKEKLQEFRKLAKKNAELAVALLHGRIGS